MGFKKRQKCPWCPNPRGCTGCSLSGDDPSSYVLMTEKDAKALVQKTNHRWLVIVSILAGSLLGAIVMVLVLLLIG